MKTDSHTIIFFCGFAGSLVGVLLSLSPRQQEINSMGPVGAMKSITKAWYSSLIKLISTVSIGVLSMVAIPRFADSNLISAFYFGLTTPLAVSRIGYGLPRTLPISDVKPKAITPRGTKKPPKHRS